MRLINLLEDNNYPETILIVDVESTCWDDKKEQGSQKNEIIEVGYCPIRSMKIGVKGSIFIKPQFSKISNFCAKLTTIKQNDIDEKGLEPKQAYSKIKNIFSGFDAWASYGEYDKNMLNKMLELYGIGSFLPEKHINLRSLFASKVLNSRDPKEAQANPMEAMKKINMSFKGVNHRGDDDAFNLARLYIKLIKNET